MLTAMVMVLMTVKRSLQVPILLMPIVMMMAYLMVQKRVGQLTAMLMDKSMPWIRIVIMTGYLMALKVA